MIVFYFSGTGNTKYIAELFAKKMDVDCHSIEELLDFEARIADNETITFCYPVYGSRVPRIMREFVSSVRHTLNEKNIIIFCTQYLFSGNGARAFSDLLELSSITVIYAEHFLMPNNISNFPPLPVADSTSQEKYNLKAAKKMDIVCDNLKTA